MQKNKLPLTLELFLFFLLLAFVSMGNGLSDSIYSNFFKEAYDISATQRGFIEFPRELPGLLCLFVVAALSFLGDVRIAFIAQLFSIVGVLALGLLSPSYAVMMFFLFIASMGMHLFLPLQDSLGMSLAEPDRVGERMGQYGSIRSVFGFIAALIVFLGFRYEFFSFTTDVISVFVISAIFFVLAAITAFLLIKRINPAMGKRQNVKFIFRKEYKYYYYLTTLHGVQKQIAFVYGSWVVVDLLGKGADTTALLTIASTFICIFFMRLIGGWIDTLGIRKMMFVDALSFIFIYLIYGFAVWSITSEVLPQQGFAVILIYVLFVLDRLSMQVGMVKSVYLRSIALSPEDITATLSTGTSLDHIVSIVAAMISGIVWETFGSHWVFFIAAAFSLGNLYVAFKIKDVKPETV